MAQKIYINQVGTYDDQEVVIEGWLYNKRSSGKLRFLQVRDGTETIQCVVFKGDVPEETFKNADDADETYLINETMPSRTTGLLVFTLQAYE